MHNRITLTWSLESGQFAQPWVSQAFSQAAATSGWTFTQVAPGGQANIPVYVDTQAPSMSLNGVGYTQWGDYGYSSARIEASIGSRTPQAMKVRLFMHEIGHVLGLDHVESMSQVMYAEVPWAGEARFGAGDRAGLALVGAGQSCVLSVGDHVWR